jgi:hypothetical protein
MKTPDVTPTQLGSTTLFLTGLGTILTTNQDQPTTLASIGALALVTVALIVSDAVIRYGRARSINSY